MSARRLQIWVACALALASVACGSDEPGPAGITGQPWRLAEVDLPDDAQGVEALLAAMPERLAGLQRTEVSPTELAYGDDRSTFVRAIDLAQAEAEGFPATPGGYVMLLIDSGEIDVEASETSPDTDLVYLVQTNTARDAPGAEPRTTYDAAWGAPDARWLFVASATSAPDREALAGAFVAAVTSLSG